jgi:hypothetical protein
MSQTKRRRGPQCRDNSFKQLQRFYDPLGLMSPVLITGKLIFQDLWCRGVEWDEFLPDNLGTLLPHLLNIHE